MIRMSSRRSLRWAAPAVVAAGVVAAAVTMNGAGAETSANLPTKSAAQLVAAVQQARPAAMSGTIVETAKLGLPDLPTSQLPGGSGLSLATLFTGSHTMRVWYGGPAQQRVALLAPLSERDVIHNGKDLWTFTSTTNEVTHSTVPQHESSKASGDVTSTTPPSVAREVLSTLAPSTRVSVDKSAVVAGRSAYELVLTPRDSRTLIGSVRIAIDSATSVPLQVQVYAVGAQSPAVQIGFTDVSFDQPPASVFDFSPPAGSSVTQQPLSGLLSGAGDPRDTSTTPREPASGGQPQVLGSGWTAVVRIPGGASALQGASTELLNDASTPVPSGRLISMTLFSVLVGNDGNLYAGAVSGSALQQVASTGHGL
jgi:outer membrane lipoprotein-sorting protein